MRPYIHIYTLPKRHRPGFVGWIPAIDTSAAAQKWAERALHFTGNISIFTAWRLGKRSSYLSHRQTPAAAAAAATAARQSSLANPVWRGLRRFACTDLPTQHPLISPAPIYLLRLPSRALGKPVQLQIITVPTSGYNLDSAHDA